jgi:hypothetical protein
MVGNARAVVVAVLASSGLTPGCSDDDEDSVNATRSGSCNGINVVYTCDEYEGDSDAIADERQFCEDIGDTWSSEPCPSTDLIGYCVWLYPVDPDQTRTYFYVGHPDSLTQIEQSCVDYNGEWHLVSEPPTELGSCNRISAISMCTEVDGAPGVVGEEHESCERMTGTWTSEPCPTTDLEGCCAYDRAGNEHRNCYYVGFPTSVTDLERGCELDGEWQAGSG